MDTSFIGDSMTQDELVQRKAMREKLEHYEQWFQSQVIGRKSTYRDDEEEEMSNLDE